MKWITYKVERYNMGEWYNLSVATSRSVARLNAREARKSYTTVRIVRVIAVSEVVR